MSRIIYVVVTGFFSIIYYFFKMKKLLKNPNATREDRYALAHEICQFVVKKARIEPIVTGMDLLPQQQGYLITPNHQGLIDPILICSYHQKPVSGVAKIEFENTFIVKDVLKLIDGKLMDRDNVRQSVRVIRAITQDLKDGRTNLIYPEGTRSKQGNVCGEFKAGSFKAAINAKAPIVPVAMVDCFKVFDGKGIKKQYPQMHFLEPIGYEIYKDMTSEEIASLVQKRIEEKISLCSDHKK